MLRSGRIRRIGSTSMTSTTRETLGPYRILGPLGAGGMGEVYVARDPSLGRTVAIKVLPQRFSHDRESLSRFTREARSASALNHPNIVTIHEVGTDAGTPYIVMEHIEGTDLRTLLRGGPPPNRRTLNIAAQIADGLAAAHEKGIVHRDLKPENVMVTKDGFVKILDFGLAKLIAPAEEDADTVHWDIAPTNPGTIVGTVGYMSPEQAHGRPLDFRSDQFSLGAILYELATGKAAFAGENALDTMTAIVREEPKPISDFNRQAPAAFVHVVERLLAKDPAHRYDSTRDAARDLHNIHDAFASTIAADEIPRPPLVKRRTLMASALVAAILIVGAAGIAVLYNRTVPVQEAPVAAKKYVAVTQFKDLTGEPNGQLVVDGLSETLASRLARFASVQVMRPSSPDSLASASSPQQVARDLGANIVLTGSMQRAGERLRVAYEVIDVTHNIRRPGELIEGSVGDLFTIQDKLADSVAASLQLGTPIFHATIPDTSVSQRRYLEALGYLRRYDNEASVDNAIKILEDLRATSNSGFIQALLGRAYLDKYKLTHDSKWAAPAAVACEHAVAADPQNPTVHLTLGDLRRETGKLDDAVHEYNIALAKQPNNADAILGLAETYKAAGKRSEAEAMYKKSIELLPNYWGAYNKLGVFYYGEARYNDAAEMFSKVVSLVPDNERAYNNLASMYMLLGRYEEALRVASASLAKAPRAQSYSTVGTANYFLGHYADAATAFEQATELEPHNYLYWFNLGDAYRWVPGANERANVAYERAIQLADEELKVNPSDIRIRSRLAVCLARRGQFAQANHEIADAMHRDPKDAGLMFKAAMIANIEHRDDEALRWLDRALRAGYSRSEVARERDFDNLRNGRLQQLLRETGTMASGSNP
jgi:tetratricopeptide (TPR) repeat protein